MQAPSSATRRFAMRFGPRPEGMLTEVLRRGRKRSGEQPEKTLIEVLPSDVLSLVLAHHDCASFVWFCARVWCGAGELHGSAD